MRNGNFQGTRCDHRPATGNPDGSGRPAANIIPAHRICRVSDDVDSSSSECCDLGTFSKLLRQRKWSVRDVTAGLITKYRTARCRQGLPGIQSRLSSILEEQVAHR